MLRSTGALVHPHVAKSRTLSQVTPAAGTAAQPASVAASNPPKANTPAYLQQAYDLSYLSASGGAGDTVAVVDAFNDPTAASDLSFYRQFYGLPACTTSNGCFRKVGQNGGSSFPPSNMAWEQEIALDLDAVSAICPQCHILLVEANSASLSDLKAAMATAVTLGADQISASWNSTQASVPSAFQTLPAVPTVAATGDAGYVGPGEDNYPAAVPGVTAAGGTSLGPSAAPSARGFGEAAWSGGGSGCDLQYARPAYQPADGCSGRAYADLSADADPATGLSVYDHATWSLIGGTSLSTPLIAAYYAITGVTADTPEWAYNASGALNDVVSGSTGNCAASIAYICNAGTGYDGPTGVGSISGSTVSGAPGIGGPSATPNGTSTYTAGVSAHGATIAGGIYRNRLDTTWWIQYGTTTTYGSETTRTDIGSGTAPVAVTGHLSKLIAGTGYHYRLVAQNSLGTTFGYDYTLTTQPAAAGGPLAAFSVTPGTPALNTSASFDASTSAPGTGGAISDYSWNFGDGTVDDEASPTTTHAYVARGTYTVTLTVTSGSQTDTSTHTVTVDDSAASFTPSSTAVPTGTTIPFNAGASTAGAAGSITDYTWDFGDDSGTVDTGTDATQSHTFTDPGTYTVTLTTTDDLDVARTTTAQINVAPFTATPALPGPNDQVSFTALDQSPGATYSWDFGDGARGDGVTATHSYVDRGHYPVSLTVQTNGTDSDPVTATVTVDTAPTAQFTPSPTVVPPGAVVGFDASASSAADPGSIVDYSWDFGDRAPTQDTGSAATASHAFTARGIYTVTVTTTDDLGATASASQQVTIDQPTASFTVSAATPAPNVPVTFDASDTNDPESSITDYSWDFGDGTSAHEPGATPAIAHPFANPGTYTVTLTATNAFGLTGTTSRVVVIPTPVTSSGTPTPPPTSTTPPPVTTPTPPVTTPAPPSLVVKLSGSGRQPLRGALTNGLRLALTINQSSRASFQITIPAARAKPSGKRAPVVLLRSVRTLAAGTRAITLKLSRAAARRLAPRGSPVLTVRVTVISAAGGASASRTMKITLTR